MSQVAERHENYVSAFADFRRDPAFGADLVGRARQAAFDRFLDRGFPTTREEEWRFTNVGPIAETAFARAGAASPAREALEPFLFPGVPAIVVVNGRVSAALSSLHALPAGVTVETGHAPRGHADATPAEPASAFVDLNTAFVEDVVTVRVAPHAIVAEPLHVLSIVSTGAHPVLASPRLVVAAGEASQMTIIESYAGLGEGRSLTNAVTDVVLGPSAVVDHVKVQREAAGAFHVASMFVRLGRASAFRSQAITFGGRIARNDIMAVLDGEGAECTLNGLYLADGDALVDTHTTIDHAKPHCPSHEVYKGILAGRAKAVFNGKIIVRPDAQKTDAKQTNKALLLTDDAQINTKPQLEIFADDVKCTHGAAIGQLDEDSMFYLRARGIAEADARSILIHAFASDILNGIKTDAVRERVQRTMEAKLRLPGA